MNTMLWIIGGLVAALVLGLLWVRLAPHDLDTVNTDPDTVKKSRKPNQYLLSRAPDADGPPVAFDTPPAKLAEAVAAMIAAQPNTQHIAGDLAQGPATYVQRTPAVGYPDYISISIRPDEANGSTLSIYARSRFGYRDFGVNKARVKRWIAELQR